MNKHSNKQNGKGRPEVAPWRGIDAKFLKRRRVTEAEQATLVFRAARRCTAVLVQLYSTAVQPYALYHRSSPLECYPVLVRYSTAVRWQAKEAETKKAQLAAAKKGTGGRRC